VTGGTLPHSLSYIPGANALLASDPVVGYDIFNLDLTTPNSAAVVSTSVPGSAQGAICWSTYSQESGNFYLVDVMQSVLTEVHLSPSLSGSIVKVGLSVIAQDLLIFAVVI
jgi:hypothetical protein